MIKILQPANTPIGST